MAMLNEMVSHMTTHKLWHLAQHAYRENMSIITAIIIVMKIGPEHEMMEVVDQEREARRLKARRKQAESWKMEGIEEFWELIWKREMEVASLRQYN